MSIQKSYSYVQGIVGVANAQVATATGEIAPPINVAIPSATTDHYIPLDLGATTADIKGIWISTTGRTLTVKTNNDTAPDQTFTVSPGYPLTWVDGMPIVRPITTPVQTGLYITNVGTTTGTLNCEFLVDPTGP